MKKVIKNLNVPKNEQVADEVVNEVAKEEVTESTNMILLKAVNEQVAERFSLGDNFYLIAFNDGKTAKITLGSEDYKVTVELQGRALYNLKEQLGLLDGM
jgi:phosphoribosylamine-glycine ligase